MLTKTSTPIGMCKGQAGFSKRTYKPKMQNIRKLKLFLKEEAKDE